MEGDALVLWTPAIKAPERRRQRVKTSPYPRYEKDLAEVEHGEYLEEAGRL